MTGAESQRRWLMKWLWCSYAGDWVIRAGISGALDADDGMPSLSAEALLIFVRVELVEDEDEEAVFMAIVVTLLAVGTTVVSRTSEDSSDKKDPEEEAAEEFEPTEETPVVEDAAEDDSMVELISGRPMS